ncbi:MAG TPA: hypothetical protein VGN07_09840 [Steroidobacteraceae bacterium]
MAATQRKARCTTRCTTETLTANLMMNSDPLSEEFLDRQRRSLVSLRAALLAVAKTHEGEESQVNQEAAGMAHEQGDDGQKLAALELTGNLVVHDVVRLGRVNRALEKIADGTYGLSDLSGSPISHERLEAVPEAVCTFDEEAEYERRQSR